MPVVVDFEGAFSLLEAESAGELYHQFSPYGQSWARFGVGRRVVIHTWPEHQLATIDVYDSREVDLSILAELGWRRRDRQKSEESASPVQYSGTVPMKADSTDDSGHDQLRSPGK